MTRPTDVGFVNPGFELPNFADINSFRRSTNRSFRAGKQRQQMA